MPFPRTKLIYGQTPLEPLPRLSAQLGIDLWIKRDDLAGVSLGGNKSRQLEYYLGAAQAEGADTILITGAVQSNFVRIAAASAARLGMKTIAQLEKRVDKNDLIYTSSGNVMLEEILGAEIMRYPDGEDEAGADAALYARADELRSEGRKPYVIPLSMSKPPLGALGYIRAAEEIITQDDAFDFIVLASGSGLTHIGMLAGLKMQESKAQVIGSCVRRPMKAQIERIAYLATSLSDLLDEPLAIDEDDIEIWDGGLSPGYGLVGAVAIEAMAMMAETEGMILDPVYTAKAFAAIPALIRSGRISASSRVLFVHTGGLPALFAYHNDLKAAFGKNGE